MSTKNSCVSVAILLITASLLLPSHGDLTIGGITQDERGLVALATGFKTEAGMFGEAAFLHLLAPHSVSTPNPAVLSMKISVESSMVAETQVFQNGVLIPRHSKVPRE